MSQTYRAVMSPIPAIVVDAEPFDAEQYVEQAAALVGLPLHPEHKPGVIANMSRIQKVASLFLDFPLPDDVEAAPVFQP